jgi:hypothetical protein
MALPDTNSRPSFTVLAPDAAPSLAAIQTALGGAAAVDRIEAGSMIVQPDANPVNPPFVAVVSPANATGTNMVLVGLTVTGIL